MTFADKTNAERKGWGHAQISHRIHFFVLSGDSKVSACGNYYFRRWMKKGRDEMNRVGPNDCAECWRVVDDRSSATAKD